MKIAVFSFERAEQACGYIRLVSPMAALAHDMDCAWAVSYKQNPLFRRRLIRTGYLDFADIAVVQRTFPQKRTVRALGKILSAGIPVIYDTDDLLFDLPQDHVLRSSFEKYKPYMLDFMRRVDVITVSTPALGERVQSYNGNVHVLPNLVDDALWSASSSPNASGKTVIGFGGSSTHAGDIAMIEEALLTIARTHGDRITFKFLGCVTERLADLPCVEFIDFQSSYREYAQTLMTAGIDIAIVPLEDTHFNRCKSNIKWLEYSACGIPGVYSDILPYNSCITQGRTGLLAGGSNGQWVEALEALITQEELRRSIGIAAHREVLSNYSLSSTGHIYSDFYRSMLQNTRQNSMDTLRKRVGRLIKRSPFKY
ncbi:MAG: glycosyltransferase [Desulfuromonadales bacterium]|nr:glycosyltransferase [Desulfuromonadales bacterium]